MRLQEGPAFSGSIIAVGVGYLLYNQTGNLLMAIASGVAVGLADYFLLIWINHIRGKNK